MKTGKTLQGSANLAFDAVDGVTHIVEGMYRNIAASAWPLGNTSKGPAGGIAGFVYRSIRVANGATRNTADWMLGHLSPGLDRTLLPGPHREAAISALNGVCGDHLARSDNALAIPMRLRVLLPTQAQQENTSSQENSVGSVPTKQQGLISNLLDANRCPVEIYPQPEAFEQDGFSPGRRLLVMVHGLSMNDREWTSHQHNHGEALAENNDYTTVYVLYNSGRNISTNGRELCHQITGLLAAWPGAVDSITFVGFSMGGLVARSAMRCAGDEGHDWLNKVDKAVYIGTPHHGAVMERGGYWLQKSLTLSPYTVPLSALGRIRSDGITDLRHGNVCDDDWQHHDQHQDHTDRRQPSPLCKNVAHYAIAATLSKKPGERIGKLMGDGLVHPSSATGRHKKQDFHLAFPEGHTTIIYGLGHLAMLRDSRVLAQLNQWLGCDRQ